MAVENLTLAHADGMTAWRSSVMLKNGEEVFTDNAYASENGCVAADAAMDDARRCADWLESEGVPVAVLRRFMISTSGGKFSSPETGEGERDVIFLAGPPEWGA